VECVREDFGRSLFRGVKTAPPCTSLHPCRRMAGLEAKVNSAFLSCAETPIHVPRLSHANLASKGAQNLKPVYGSEGLSRTNVCRMRPFVSFYTSPVTGRISCLGFEPSVI